MQKTSFKILLSVLLVLVIATTYCFATTEPQVTSTDDAQVLTTGADGEEATEVEGEESSAEADQTADWTRNDLYKIDNSITISNIVDGNVFVMGKDVKITSEIGGDVFVIADKLEIDGAYIYSSIFALANEITINGTVYDVYAACNTFNVGERGLIYRDLRLTAQDLNISGIINRNAYVSVGNITFAENANQLVRGNLNYTSSKPVSIPNGAVVGQTNFSQEEIKEAGNNGILSHFLNLIGSLILTAVVTLILVWLTPKFVERVGNTNLSKSFVSLGIGFLAPICLIIASVILLITVVGVPVFVAISFAFVVLAYVAKCITSIFFGNLFAKKLNKEGKWNLVLYSCIVTLILWAVSLIPIIGSLVSIVASIFGIGLTLVNMVCKNEKVEKAKTKTTKAAKEKE